MDREPNNSECMVEQATGWLSTLLSIPLIWPKASVLAVVGVLTLGVGWAWVRATAPAVLPPPAVDLRRIAELEQQVQKDITERTPDLAGAPRDSNLRGLFDGLADPKPRGGGTSP
jgi:hypothetical protein